MLKVFGLLMGILVLSACAPTVGSPEWCTQMKQKNKTDWSINEATEYTKNCIF